MRTPNHTLYAAAFAALLMSPSAIRADATLRTRYVDAIPATGVGLRYLANRAPLLPSPLARLPVGAIRPEGWLRTQLARMADGMTGRLAEVSPWVRFQGSAWASSTGRGNYGWEELPYWLKGYTDLGYVLHDRRIIAGARLWIDAILASQRPDGYFGPESNRATPDLWPNMLALWALRSHYEATGDRRVLPFMTRYFRWVARLPLDRYLPDDWQKWRGADNLDVLYWLYNRTGETWLLDLARVTHERTADWVGGIPTWHGVNIAQGFREPAQYYQQTRDVRYLRAAVRDYDLVRGLYGQVPGGMYGADENARPGYTGPRQGAETCAIVEMMYSQEEILRITGAPLWADRCEEVAFNSLPAAMTPDLKALHYLTAPNQVELDRRDHSPGIQNGGDMFSYSPYEQYRCCQHNVAFGWPYFAEHLWMATAGGGLAATLYAPCTITAVAGDGTPVTITETTDYPFDERVTLRLRAGKATRFPLFLRVPAWCSAPQLRVNGHQIGLPGRTRGWLQIDRVWRDGDRVALTLPMRLRLDTWPHNRNTVSVSRGPLTYSLQIGERWERYGAPDRWASWEVHPTTPWNYGLTVSPGTRNLPIRVERRPGPLAAQPFTPDAAPIRLYAPARRIEAWKQEADGLVGEVQPGPIRTETPEEEVTLIPMGCARLRISAFPRISNGPEARGWNDTPTATASYRHEGDPLGALTDGLLPARSADQTIPRFTWWDHLGTAEWVEYDYAAPREVRRCGVYWFDDEATGGQCRTPQAWRLLWWDGGAWQPVLSSQYPAARDRMNTVSFAPIRTTRLRLETQLRPGYSAGILEWQVAP